MKYQWGENQEEYFTKIKEAITQAPALMSHDFSKDFQLYTFALDNSYVVVLTQKNENGDEVLLTFMIFGLQGADLNYPAIDKQDFIVFKAVKHFQPYLLKNHTTIIVPHPVVSSLLV